MAILKRVQRPVIAVLLLFIMQGGPQAADLHEIYQLAKSNDSLWAMAQSRYQADVEKGPQAGALLLPSIGLSASYGQNQDSLTVPTMHVDGTFDYNTTAYRLSVVQPIYNKPIFAGYKEGQFSVRAAEHNFALARADLIYKTSEAYLGVLSAQDALHTASSNEQAVQKRLGLIQRNFQVGSATSIDVQEARARYDLSASQTIQARNQLHQAQQVLRVIINTEPPPLHGMHRDKPLPPPAGDDLDKLAQAAARENYGVLATEQLLQVAELEVERRRGGHYPALDLVASHSYTDSGGNIFGNPSTTSSNQVVLQMNVPLYQGGRVDSQVREALANRNELRDRLEQQRRLVGQQTRDIGMTLVNEYTRIKTLQGALESNEKALQATILGFEKGLRSGLDVLNAQQQLTLTRLSLSQGRYAYLLARLRLKLVQGVITEQDLDEINRLLG